MNDKPLAVLDSQRATHFESRFRNDVFAREYPQDRQRVSHPVLPCIPNPPPKLSYFSAPPVLSSNTKVRHRASLLYSSSAFFEKTGGEVSIQQYDVVQQPKLEPGQALIKVEYSGVCHTDLHA